MTVLPFPSQRSVEKNLRHVLPVEKIRGCTLPDGRVEATVTQGTMAGAKTIFICVPPEAAYFNRV